MIAVAGGLGSACCWTITALLAQRAARTIGELAAYAWTVVFGLLFITAPAVIALTDTHVSAGTGRQLILAGTFNVIGLTAQFSALRHGRASMILPITSAEGAVAAALAAATGARIGPLGWTALAAVVIGLGVTAVTGRGDAAADRGAFRDSGLAVIAALAFGTGLYLQGHAALHAPLGLAIAPPNVMGVLLVAGPLAGARRLPSPRGAIAVLPAVAVAEILGFIGYLVGARHSLPVAALLSSQYATISVIVGVLVFRERPRPAQMLGYALIIVGVGLISVHQ